MAEPFKTGDVVLLKSGGNPMTVLNHVTGSKAADEGWSEFVTCDWLSNGEHHRQKFHPSQLSHAIKIFTHVDAGRVDVSWTAKPDYDITLGPPELHHRHALTKGLKDGEYRTVTDSWLK